MRIQMEYKKAGAKKMKKIGLLISTLVIGGSFLLSGCGSNDDAGDQASKSYPSIFLLGRYIGEKIRSIN